jgi:hypothetical protein
MSVPPDGLFLYLFSYSTAPARQRFAACNTGVDATFRCEDPPARALGDINKIAAHPAAEIINTFILPSGPRPAEGLLRMRRGAVRLSWQSNGNNVRQWCESRVRSSGSPLLWRRSLLKFCGDADAKCIAGSIINNRFQPQTHVSGFTWRRFFSGRTAACLADTGRILNCVRAVLKLSGLWHRRVSPRERVFGNGGRAPEAVFTPFEP